MIDLSKIDNLEEYGISLPLEIEDLIEPLTQILSQGVVLGEIHVGASWIPSFHDLCAKHGSAIGHEQFIGTMMGAKVFGYPSAESIVAADEAFLLPPETALEGNHSVKLKLKTPPKREATEEGDHGPDAAADNSDRGSF